MNVFHAVGKNALEMYNIGTFKDCFTFSTQFELMGKTGQDATKKISFS